MENIKNYTRILLLPYHSHSPHLLQIKFNLRQMNCYILSNFQKRPTVYANYPRPKHRERAVPSNQDSRR